MVHLRRRLKEDRPEEEKEPSCRLPLQCDGSDGDKWNGGHEVACEQYLGGTNQGPQSIEVIDHV